MKKRLLDFKEKLSMKKKITMAIITMIIGIIVEVVVIGIWIKFIGTTNAIIAMLMIGMTAFLTFCVCFWLGAIECKKR